MKNLVLLIIGGVTVVGVGTYFFLRKKPIKKNTQSNIAPQNNLVPQDNLNVGDTKVGSTSVGSTSIVGSSNVSPVIDNKGNLSGSTNNTTSGQPISGSSSQGTSVINTAEYQRKLNLANIAFEELKILKEEEKNPKLLAGKCAQPRPYNQFFDDRRYNEPPLNCLRFYTIDDDFAIARTKANQIKEKEKIIADLGFKAVGDKLFYLN
jgi:hypothetical protein